MNRTILIVAALAAAIALSACSEAKTDPKVKEVGASSPPTASYMPQVEVPLATYQLVWSFHSTSDTYGFTPVKQKHVDLVTWDGIRFVAQYGPAIGSNVTTGSPAAAFQLQAGLQWNPDPFYFFAGLQASAVIEQGRQGVSGKAGLTAGFGYRF